MQADTCFSPTPVSTEELRLVPEEIQDAIAFLALNRWPGDYDQQCQEMLWQLTAYCQVRKLRLASDPYNLQHSDTPPPFDFVARLENFTRNSQDAVALN